MKIPPIMFDIGFDAPIADIGKEDMYWTFNGAKFVIQGVPKFDKDQEFPLGIKVAKAGLVRIKIDAFENIDNGLQIYIKDGLLNSYHKINKNSFEINLDPGNYLDRFSLVFSPSKNAKEQTKLDVSDEILENGIQVFMNNQTSEIKIKRTVDTEFLSIDLYNILGQKTQTWNTNISDSNVSLLVNVASGVYLVKINTTNGTVSKKIVIE